MNVQVIKHVLRIMNEEQDFKIILEKWRDYIMKIDIMNYLLWMTDVYSLKTHINIHKKYNFSV